MKLDKKLISDRITIRNYEIEDKEFCTSMWFDKENGRYLSDPTEEYVDDIFQNAVDTLQESADGYYFVIENNVDGKRIGSCCAFPNEDKSVIDIGYCIKRKYWRNGYATEAVGKLIEWASQQGYKSITAEVAKENEASCGLMRKLGFKIKKETTFSKYHMDVSYDSYIYEYIV